MTINTNSSDLPTQPPLAVVGLSALFPKAANTDEFWSNIRRGVDAITEVPATHWNPDEYFDRNQKTADMTYARRGGFLSPLPFDPLEFGISPNNLEAIDTSQLLGMVGAKRALEHAGYGAGRVFDRSRVGCILGVTGTLEMVIPLGARLGHPRWRKALKDAGVADDVAADVVNRISESYVPWQENSFPGLLGNVVAGRIANRLDLHGTNCVVDAACASSLSAIHLAALELWTGRSDMVVTGGIDTFNDIFMFMCFSKTPALSPSGDAKPFSDEADGTILGEGVGMLVLKRLADAQRDGDRIYAVLKGIGTSSDGAGNAVYAPKAEGQIRCLEDAYRVAGVSPDTIELVEAHGTGTKVGDATEVSGLMHVYKSTGRRGAWCAVGSVKSQIGHTKAAAGAAGVIKAILALQHRVLPPTIKVNQPPAAILTDDSPFYVNTEARPWLKPRGYPRRAAVSAFGFGGSNFHCVLEESPQRFDEPEWDGDVQVVAFSADTANELTTTVRSTLTPLNTTEWRGLRTVASSSREAFRVDQSHRVLFVIERDKTDIAKLVAGALTMLERYGDKTAWSTPDGAYYGRGVRSGKLGVLFPGQGSQYVGMLRELVCRFPVMSDILAEANEVFSSAPLANGHAATTNRLSDYIYPHPAFSAETRVQHEADLRATQIAQPAIGAVSLAVLAVLDHFGVRPEAVAGHSYGELTALCASRRFAPHVLYRLSMLRGQLMAAAQEVDGGMLAVGAPLTQIQAALKELAVDLVVANHNGPTQVVLSGRIPEIDRANALFASRNIRGKKLSVAAAFHSPLVATASRAFRPVLDDVEFVPSSMPVYANSTATEYPAEPTAARDLLASQLARPVNFVGEVEQMYADGVRTFVEVGPGGVLTGLVNSILNGSDYRAMAIDSSNGKRSGLLDLASSLAQLSAEGNPIRWEMWDPQGRGISEQGSAQRLRIPICGANYVKPRPPIPPRPATNVVDVKHEAVVRADAKPIQPAPPPIAIEQPKREQLRPVEPSPQIPPAPLETIRPMTNTIPTKTEPLPHITVARTSNAGTVETIRQTLAALERMQHETSRLHQQFLEGQHAALQMYARLSQQQVGESQIELKVDGHAVSNAPSHSESVLQPVPKQIETRFERSPMPSTSSSGPVLRHADFSSPVNLPSPPKSTSPIIPVAVTVPPPPPVEPTTPAPSVMKSVAPAAKSPAPIMPVLIPVAQPAPASPVVSALASRVLAVVSQKTGYPTEMLSLEMSLDHDLGIDSIKRVEILSALQEQVPNLPAFQPDELGSLHTLQDVVALADARTGKVPNQMPARGSMPASGISDRSRFSGVQTTKNQGADPPRSPGNGTSELGPIVLAVVSEKTGYPTEMLNLEMSLDHDLGIDSIKRVEILSALQERVPNLPAFQPEELGSLHTLRDVVALADARAGKVPNETPASVSSSTSDISERPLFVDVQTKNQRADTPRSPGNGTSELGPIVLSVVSEKTGYPVEMLNLEMSLDHDLGIDSIKRVEILSELQERVPNLPAFQPEELGGLHTLRDVVMLADARSTTGPNHSPVSDSLPKSSDSSRSLPVGAYTTKNQGADTPRSPGDGTRALGSIVLAVVSEKTGYPVEMLNLEMSLDHDLGIDSIKRVEILSALQDRVPNLPAFQPEELGALHTLKDVVTLAGDRTANVSKSSVQNSLAGLDSVGREIVQAPAQVLSLPVTHPVAIVRSNRPLSISRSIVRPVAISPAHTRFPLKLLPGSEIWVTEDNLGHSLRIADELTNRGFKPRIVNIEEPQVSTVPEGLAGLILVAPSGGMTDRQLWRAVEWVQKVGPTLRRNGASSASLLVTISRLDGQFGFAGSSALQDPISGGLAGIAKCAAREWPEITSRAIDLGQDWSASQIAASMVVAELLHEGPVEVGITSNGSYALEVVEESLEGKPETSPIEPGEVIVVSGGARGVTAEVAFAVARAWHPRLVILGRSPEPTPEPDWLARLSTDAEIKQALITRAPAGTTPKAIAAECQQIAAGREIAQQLQRLRSTGVPVIYHSVDVRDATTVKPLLARIRRDYGAIRGIIHGAGVLADQRIEDKTKQQFERVYQTKIDGLKTLLECTEPSELRMLGVFSSYTARFGRTGQLDYAIANEVLNKQARQFAIRHPDCRVASFNWGPWDGGMVQGGLKQLFASEGVGLIPMDEGAELFVRELGQTASRPVEVLVLAPTNTPSAAPANATQEFKVAFERELDVARNSFLESHALGGKAVLPVAIILEWLAHGAIHRNPGLELHGFEEFRIFQGIRLGRHDRVSLRVLSGKPVREDGCYRVPMRLIGQNNGRDVIHAGGNVVLSSNFPAAPFPTLQVAMRPYSMDRAAAYASRLFHGPQFEGIIAIDGCSEEGIVVTSRSAPAASAWMQEPARGNWLADPLVIDAALQAIILWSQEFCGKPCLPCAVTSYRQFRRTFPRDGVRIIIRVQPGADQLIRCDVEFVDQQGLLIARMEGCESVAEGSLTAAFRKNQIEA